MDMKLAILAFVLGTALMTVLGVGFVSEPPSPAGLAVSPSCLVVQEEPDPHQGQPERCTNARTEKGQPHFCECKKDAEACDAEDKKCKVYCHKDHCHCFHAGCDS
jgi:hypothetical protein